MKSYFSGNTLWLKVAANSIRDLLLQLTQIPPLGGDPTRAGGRIPRSDEKSGILTWLDLENYFIRSSQ